jgi:carbon storage regulator CsrA
MLILSRKKNDRVLITIPASTEKTIVEVKVTETSKSQAKIGFLAPKCVDVTRDDIKKRKDKTDAIEA